MRFSARFFHAQIGIWVHSVKRHDMLAMATMYFYLAISVRLCFIFAWNRRKSWICIDLCGACFVQVYALDSDCLLRFPPRLMMSDQDEYIAIVMRSIRSRTYS